MAARTSLSSALLSAANSVSSETRSTGGRSAAGRSVPSRSAARNTSRYGSFRSATHAIQTSDSAAEAPASTTSPRARNDSDRISTEASACPPRWPTRSMSGFARERTPSGSGT